MNKNSVAKVFKNTQRTIVKYSPELLTGIGIAGMFSMAGLAVKATPKAIALLEEKKKAESKEELTHVEIVKTTWKCYIPAVVAGTFSAACLIGANSVNARRNAALATAYKLSETALIEYREKATEVLGEKKEKLVREKVNQAKMEKHPVAKNEVIITEKGNTLCYDPTSGRYFKSDIDKIKRTENILNRKMLTEMYISLNEFYDELGLEQTSMGDTLGWNIDGMIDIDFTSHLTPDGEPCLVMDHKNPPRYGYSKLI